MTYTNHVIFHINDLKAFREGEDVGWTPEMQENECGNYAPRPTVVLLLSPSERRRIAADMSISEAAKTYNISNSTVLHCREEFQRTNGQMDQETTVIINQRRRTLTLEKMLEIARDKREASSVAEAFGVASMTVRRVRELYQKGLLKR